MNLELIDTLWNVNELKNGDSTERNNRELIDTLWNVNTKIIIPNKCTLL